MITRRDVLADAINKCIKELYSLAQPKVDYDDFIEENKIFLKKEKEYYNLPKENRPSYYEYMGPKPYEFYYLPQKVFKEIADSYVYAYRLDEKQEFLDDIEVLKQYCKDPIVDKWIEGEGDNPGHSGYDHPDNLEKEISGILCLDNTLVDPEMAEDAEDYENKLNNLSKQICNKFFEFLDMAGKFFNWNRYLNGFNTNVYLGGTPNSNKEAVIENWKKYRNKDIEIDESIYDEEDEDLDI